MPSHSFHSHLTLLQELAMEFGRANPALASLLERPGTDPDVERLIDAVAYQNVMLRRKLESDFPELVYDLAQLILPHYLRPIPASTIIGFTPHGTLGQSATIPAGTQLASLPVDGVACRFTTTAEVTLHPLEITEASCSRSAALDYCHAGTAPPYLVPKLQLGDAAPGQAPLRQFELSAPAGEIRLSLALKGLPLQHWQPRALRLFLAGDRTLATELYLLLSRHLVGMLLTPESGGTAMMLPPDCLTPAGFDEADAVLPYPPHAFPGYRLLQEYFVAADKFLFFDLTGWEQWQQRGEGMQFSIIFLLDRCPSQPQRIRRESFALHAVPALNLFFRDADPICVDHRASSHLIRPAGLDPAHCQVLSVDLVTGYDRRTGRERRYLPFDSFGCAGGTEPVYHAQRVQTLRQGGQDLHLSLAFPAGSAPAEPETLSVALTCTNRSLPDRLHPGEISTLLSPLSDAVSASNITPVNPGRQPPLGPGLLRQLISHLYLNRQSLEKLEHLQALLKLYLFPAQPGGSADPAALKRIAGLEALEVLPDKRKASGICIRGREVRIKLRQDHFSGPADVHLFGCVLDSFLGGYGALHSCTRLTLHDTSTGGRWQWPTRPKGRSIP